MKKAILFKTLVDVLYIFHFIGLIGIIPILTFGTVKINQANTNVEDWNIIYWLLFIASIFTYIIFLRGLYFLRKMARFLLTKRYFSDKTVQNLKNSGKHFLYTGILYSIIIVFLWINKLRNGKFEITYNDNILIPFFLCIVGMFFIIQSNALGLAKDIKEENELTV